MFDWVVDTPLLIILNMTSSERLCFLKNTLIPISKFTKLLFGAKQTSPPLIKYSKIFQPRHSYSNSFPFPRLLKFGRNTIQQKLSRSILVLYRWKSKITYYLHITFYRPLNYSDWKNIAYCEKFEQSMVSANMFNLFQIELKDLGGVVIRKIFQFFPLFRLGNSISST